MDTPKKEASQKREYLFKKKEKSGGRHTDQQHVSLQQTLIQGYKRKSKNPDEMVNSRVI